MIRVLMLERLANDDSSRLALGLGAIARCDRPSHLSLTGVRRLRPAVNGDPRSMCLLFWVFSDVLKSFFVDLDPTGWVDIDENLPFLSRGTLPAPPSLGHFSVSRVAAEGMVAQLLKGIQIW